MTIYPQWIRILLIMLLTEFISILEIYSQHVNYDDNEGDVWLKHVENMFDKNVEQEMLQQEIERLWGIINNPIDVNLATRETLEQLPFLEDKAIQSLLYYVYVYGPMQTLYELSLVNDFDANLVALVRPFLKIEPIERNDQNDLWSLLQKSHHRVLLRTDLTHPLKQGYRPGGDYVGSRSYYSLRYQLESRNQLRIGVVLEKDAGEKGLDYASFFLRKESKGMFRDVIVGNYKLRFGTGILLNNGFSLGKSLHGALSLDRAGGIMAHQSVDEYHYFQGVACELALRSWRLLPFWSYRQLDADVKDDTIRTINRSGLHRTLTQREARNQAYVMSYGMRLAYRWKSAEFGCSGVRHLLSHEYDPPETVLNQYRFRGCVNEGVSLDYRYHHTWFRAVGELAYSGPRRWATLHRIALTPQAGWSLQVLYRFYSRAYEGWCAKSYSEGSIVNDEEGISIYCSVPWMRYFTSQVGVDFFHFSWVKSGIMKPSYGYELNYKQRYQQADYRYIDFSYKLKMREKNRDATLVNPEKVGTYQRHQWSMSYTARLGHIYYLQGGYEHSLYCFADAPRQQGLLLSQRLGFYWKALSLKGDIGFALFDTESTFAKVYLSEKNLLYGFGYPSFYGVGRRFSLVLQWECGDWLKVAGKWGFTHYEDREEQGSGQELIPYPYRNDLTLQVSMKF